MTFDGDSVNVALGFLVIPFLLPSFPDLPFSTPPADKRLVKIEVRQTPVRVDVIQLVVISSDN